MMTGHKYVFNKDKQLKDKLPIWAPVFASMLVKRAFETKGFVADCDRVKHSSQLYRKGQDFISAFIQEYVVQTGNQEDFVRKTQLYADFNLWFVENHGKRGAPKGTELAEKVALLFGPETPKKGWYGLKVTYGEKVETRMASEAT
jgi:hypothetical protein